MRRLIATGLLTALALSAGRSAFAEEITLTTYYPSPRAVYRELRTTNNTYLAQQAGALIVGTRATLPATLSTVRLVAVGPPASPSAGVCPPAAPDWYDEDGDAFLDALECRRTALAVAGNSVGLGTRRPAAGALMTVVGQGGDPIAGACPPGTDWYDENASGVGPEVRECRRTGLAIGRTGAVGLGLRPALTSTLELSLKALPGPPTTELLLEAGDPTVVGQVRQQFSLQVDGDTAAPNPGLYVRDLVTAGSPVRLSIDSTGQVGIGTTTPQATLQVSDPNPANLTDGNGSLMVAGVMVPGRFATDAEASAAAPQPVPEGAIYHNIGVTPGLRIFRGGTWASVAAPQVYRNADRTAIFGGKSTGIVTWWDPSGFLLPAPLNAWFQVSADAATMTPNGLLPPGMFPGPRPFTVCPTLVNLGGTPNPGCYWACASWLGIRIAFQPGARGVCDAPPAGAENGVAYWN